MISIRNSKYIYSLLFLILFILGSCAKKVNKPINGDVYIVALDTNLFTTWRITKIKGKYIWYITNDYNVSEKYLTDSINHLKNYTDSPIQISKKEFTKKQNIYLIKTQKK